jgi:drug/metabolite transporter (DMT)-like permease
MKSENLVVSSAASTLSPLVIACLAATWLVWGSTYLAIKFVLVSFPPFFGMGTRFILAGIVLLLWMRFARGAAWPTRQEWRNGFIIGSLMCAGGMGFTAYSEQSVSSGLVVAFIAVCPVMMALGNLIWKIYPTKIEALGIAIGLVGVLLLTQGAGFSASPVGLIAVGSACFFWTAGSVLSQRVPALALAPGATGFASEMILGGVSLMVMAAFNNEYQTFAALWPPTPAATAAWLYLVVAGSLIAFNAYMVLLARTSAALAGSYCFVNPIIALVLGIVVAGEVVSGFEWVAAGITLVGVVLVLLGRAK